MSRTIERADGNLIDRLLNLWPFCLDEDSIRTVAVAWLFKENGAWVFKSRKCGDESLFYNAVFFMRLSLPFDIFWSIRWAENWRRSFLQTGIGWKGNGRFAILFRIQSNQSATEGVTGENFGQATGFNYGTHLKCQPQA